MNLVNISTLFEVYFFPELKSLSAKILCDFGEAESIACHSCAHEPHHN